MTCGVYRIEIGDWFYYGSAKYFPRRKAQHWHLLKTGKHGNAILQHAYNKYGTFVMYLVDVCTPDALLAREQYFLDAFVGKYRCANIARNAEATWVGKTHTEASKKKISENRKGKGVGEANGFYGKSHSNEVKSKISASRKGKTAGGNHPSAKKVRVLFKTGQSIVFETGRSAASFFDKSPAYICKLLTGCGKLPNGVENVDYC